MARPDTNDAKMARLIHNIRPDGSISLGLRIRLKLKSMKLCLQVRRLHLVWPSRKNGVGVLGLVNLETSILAVISQRVTMRSMELGNEK